MFFSVSVLSLNDKTKEREKDICIGSIYPSPQNNEILLRILYFHREYFRDVEMLIFEVYTTIWPNFVAYAFFFFFFPFFFSSEKIGRY